MARARNLKPAFFKNDDLAQCEHGARLLFAGLWTIADREGRLEDRPIRIKGELFPYETCGVAPWLDQLAKFGFITRYEVAGRKYIQVNNFSRHQNPHVHEPASTIPPPDEHSVSTVPAPDSSNRESVIGNQDSGISNRESGDGRAAKFVPPTVDEVAEYCRERKNKVDPQRFVDFYASKGWCVGKNKMKDWKAAIRGAWESDAARAPTKATGDPRGNIAVVADYIAREAGTDG